MSWHTHAFSLTESTSQGYGPSLWRINTSIAVKDDLCRGYASWSPFLARDVVRNVCLSVYHERMPSQDVSESDERVNVRSHRALANLAEPDHDI